MMVSVLLWCTLIRQSRINNDSIHPKTHYLKKIYIELLKNGKISTYFDDMPKKCNIFDMSHKL
jgi:hypothetical protein